MSAGIGRQFMRETQYQYMEPSAQQQGQSQPPLELPYDTTQRPVALPDPDALPLDPVDLRAMIRDRRTVRNYLEQEISPEELAFLLWASQGITDVRGSYATVRTVPSAGARHAFETFLLISQVAGIEPGLYRWIASMNQLVPVTLARDIAERVTRAALNQEQVLRSAVTFIWVAVRERMAYRYGERGYRYLFLDAGHVCQNLYLAAEPLGCGVCAMAAFDDEEVNAVLDLDGDNLFAVYMASLGKRRVR